MTSNSRSFLSLSLSGAGHLLPYHLGVCTILLSEVKKKALPPLRAVYGSSSGAIAAVVVCLLPHRITDFAEYFINNRGHALHHLHTVLTKEENEQKLHHHTTKENPRPIICVTKCRDGSFHLFEGHGMSSKNLMHLVRASCTIPRYFHPVDLISSGRLTYAESDGVEIDGEWYVDGGIAAPAPPMANGKTSHGVVVSPISCSDKNNLHRISPIDTSFSFLWRDIRLRGDFRVRPSIHNLQALKVSTGAASTRELRLWYNRGIEDAESFMQRWHHR